MTKSIAALSLYMLVGCQAMAATKYADTPMPAHRGESFVAPENTMAAYALAWKNGEKAIETDIHLSKDGQVVIMHDYDTFRTSGKKVKLAMKDATVAELQKVDVGAWKGPEWAGQTVPTLRQLYEAMPAGTKCFTEIKSGVDVVPAHAALVKEMKKGPDQIVVISFKADALEASKRAMPEYKHYFLANHKKDKATGEYLPTPNVDEWIATAKRIKADGLDLQAVPPLTQAECKKVLDAGLELHVWTVDDPAVAKRYLDWGAMSVTTNRPAWMRQELAKFDKK
jgi:glycerophosphoryl diester phosphodiesterase